MSSFTSRPPSRARPSISDAEVAAIVAEHDRSLREIDPLIGPPPGPGSDGDRVDLVADGPAGRGIARILPSVVTEDDEAALWGTLRSWRLRYHLSGGDRAGVFAELLDGFEASVQASVEPNDAETALLVSLPSRDVELATPLARRGFAATTVVAARTAPRHGGSPDALRQVDAGPAVGTRPQDDQVMVRPAERDDLDVLTELAADLNRFDAWFGGVTARPTAPRLLGASMKSALQQVPAWTWVAQDRDGTLLGLAQVQPPGAAAWIAPAVDAPEGRVAYLGLLFVRPDQRARGVGTRLVELAHRALDDRNIAVTLLHHSLPNPYSTPFWARQGYRPLWTGWQRRPAWRTGQP